MPPQSRAAHPGKTCFARKIVWVLKGGVEVKLLLFHINFYSSADSLSLVSHCVFWCDEVDMGELTIYRASISEFSRHGVLLAMTQDKSVRHSYSSVQTTPHHTRAILYSHLFRKKFPLNPFGLLYHSWYILLLLQIFSFDTDLTWVDLTLLFRQGCTRSSKKLSQSSPNVERVPPANIPFLTIPFTHTFYWLLLNPP